MRVPLGVVGQAVGVASFPFLAQLYSEKKFDELNRTLNATLKGLLLILVPVSALTIVERLPLVYLVFSHTRLRAPDLYAIASTLAIFSVALFAWGVQNILARAFYAARDTLTPAIVGTALTFLNLPVYWLLVKRAQHLGLAMASSIGIVAYTVALFVILRRRTHNPGTGALLVFSLKIAAASVASGMFCYRMLIWLEARVAWRTTHGALLVVVLTSAAGFLIVGILAKLLRVREVDLYLKKLHLWRSKNSEASG
jgi:putative peptidoglycan lipid II flippase